MNEKPKPDIRRYRPAFIVEKENTEIALDEGYGVTRRVVRTDCSTVQ